MIILGVAINITFRPASARSSCWQEMWSLTACIIVFQVLLVRGAGPEDPSPGEILQLPQ